MSSIDKNLSNFTDERISSLFVDYVTSMEDKERHTSKACEEVMRFDKFCEEILPGDVKKQTETYNRMMDVAVEYEESGFIAGFKTAVHMLKEQGKCSMTMA